MKKIWQLGLNGDSCSIPARSMRRNCNRQIKPKVDETPKAEVVRSRHSRLH